MREAVLIGRATRISSPHGVMLVFAGSDALFEGPATGCEDSGCEYKGSDVSDLLAREVV